MKIVWTALIMLPYYRGITVGRPGATWNQMIILGGLQARSPCHNTQRRSTLSPVAPLISPGRVALEPDDVLQERPKSGDTP